MSKHKHYEMIVAKAANIELVQFIKINKKWEVCGEYDKNLINFHSVNDHFLCLPQHKEACLHWLNGGDVLHWHISKWLEVDDYYEDCWADGNHGFLEEEELRIKPKKVKKWIGVHAKSGLVTQGCCDTEREIEEHVLRGACSPKAKFCDWQFIEIEVEE